MIGLSEEERDKIQAQMRIKNNDEMVKDIKKGGVYHGISISSTIENDSLRNDIREILKEELKVILGETTSLIEPHEEQEAKDFIEKHLGFPAPKSCLFWMHVKIHYDEKDVHYAKDDNGNQILKPDGSPLCIYLPEKAKTDEKYTSTTALVVSQGPACYKGERFKYSGRSCKVGDWIVIPPNEGYYTVYRGIPMRIITDDKCLGVVEDPSYVTRT